MQQLHTEIDLLLCEDTASTSSTKCSTICSADSKQHQNFLFQVDVERNRERHRADPSNNYISKTLKQIFSNISAINDQNVITGRRQT